MPINRAKFFDVIRINLFVRISASQLKGMESIITEWDRLPGVYTDKRHLGYMFATAYHETASTMQAINEYGKGKGRPYGKKIKMSGVPYISPDRLYYGRGKVQLTWYENYQLMGRLLGIDLLNNPELALNDEIANKIMFEGMMKGSSSFGDFTGKCLEMYFNENIDDPLNARRIINGKDKAALIAGYHRKFLEALS